MRGSYSWIESRRVSYEEEGEAQDCSGLAGVRGHLHCWIAGAVCHNGTVNSAIRGLGNLGSSSRVILTVIVMMPDKNFQFLGQKCSNG